MLKIINVVGARPNFMKVAPIVDAMRRRSDDFLPLIVHNRPALRCADVGRVSSPTWGFRNRMSTWVWVSGSHARAKRPR